MLLTTPNFDNAKVVPVKLGLFIGAKLDNVVNRSIPFKDNAFVEIDGDVTTPVNVGLAIFDFKAKAFVVAVESGLFKSDVLFTFPNPTFEGSKVKFETIAFVKSTVEPLENVKAPCKFTPF